MGPERRAAEPGHAGLSGLRRRVTRALEQAPARDAELPGDLAGDELGLVETPRSTAPAGWSAPR